MNNQKSSCVGSRSRPGIDLYHAGPWLRCRSAPPG